MKNDTWILWYYPTYFFLFIALYVSFKFVAIFFFRAAYQPQFILDLTPMYLLEGINNSQLVFISFLVVTINAYFHVFTHACTCGGKKGYQSSGIG